jgi:hypothetical protein
MFKRILLIGVCLLSAGCSAPEYSREALEKSGYTDIQVGGYDFFACSDDDTFATKFTASNPHGQVVSGTVCCGLFKSCTVRF